MCWRSSDVHTMYMRGSKHTKVYTIEGIPSSISNAKYDEVHAKPKLQSMHHQNTKTSLFEVLPKIHTLTTGDGSTLSNLTCCRYSSTICKLFDMHLEVQMCQPCMLDCFCTHQKLPICHKGDSHSHKTGSCQSWSAAASCHMLPHGSTQGQTISRLL